MIPVPHRSRAWGKIVGQNEGRLAEASALGSLAPSGDGDSDLGEDLFSKAFSLSSDCLAVVRVRDRSILRASLATCRLWGTTEPEVVGKSTDTYFRWISAKDRLRFARLLNTDGECLNTEASLRINDGRVLHFMISARLITLKGEACVLSVMRDITERTQATAALRDSQQRHRSLFEHMVEGYAYCRLIVENGRPTDFIYEEVNTAFETLTGLKDVSGKRISEVIPGFLSRDSAIFEMYCRVVLTGKPERCEVHMKSLNFWLLLSVYSPEQGYFVVIFDNITERKESEFRVRFNELRYRSLLNATTAIVWDTPPSGEFEVEQASWSAFTGQSFEELSGSGWLDAVHPEDRAHTREVWLAAVANRTVFEVEHRLRAADHSYHHMMVRGVPILGETGEVIQWIGVHMDISEQKRIGDALRAKTALFEAQVDCALDGILVVDSAGRKILQNRRLVDLWQIPESIAEASDDAGQLRFVAAKTKDPENFKEKVEYLSTHPGEVSRDEIQLADGRTFDRYSAPIQDKAAHYYGRIWTFRDVTEERNREQKISDSLIREKHLLHEAEAGIRAKSEFLAVMSHEIRTPMSGILGFSEMLAATPDLPAHCSDYVKTILSSGAALLRILDDILVFSRLDAGGLEVENSLFNARDVLQEIHDLFRPQASKQGLDFEVSFGPGDSLYLWNDAGRLRQVLLNLVSNALKFTVQGSITIGIGPPLEKLTSEDFGVDVFVKDSGRGISKQELGHVFEPFAQADSSISRRYGGTGLGLSISNSLVLLMGGRLSVTSTVGVGSEFRLTIPAALPLVAAAASQKQQDQILDVQFAIKHPLNVLLVEDDKANIKLMLLMLRNLGYAAIVANDGIEAVDMFQRNHPDFILMDLQMPRKDGLTATKEIREIESAAPDHKAVFISALTANIMNEDRQRCFEAGMDSVMNKPIRRATLASMLARASQVRNAGTGG